MVKHKLGVFFFFLNEGNSKAKFQFTAPNLLSNISFFSFKVDFFHITHLSHLEVSENEVCLRRKYIYDMVVLPPSPPLQPPSKQQLNKKERKKRKHFFLYQWF